MTFSWAQIPIGDVNFQSALSLRQLLKLTVSAIYKDSEGTGGNFWLNQSEPTYREF